jgi:hypothetical protein
LIVDKLDIDELGGVVIIKVGRTSASASALRVGIAAKFTTLARDRGRKYMMSPMEVSPELC